MHDTGMRMANRSKEKTLSRNTGKSTDKGDVSNDWGNERIRSTALDNFGEKNKVSPLPLCIHQK